MKRLSTVSAVLAILIGVSGCSATSSKKYNENEVKRNNYDDTDKEVMKLLAGFTDGVNKSLRVLAEVKNAEMKSEISQEAMTRLEWENNIVPPNLDTQMSFNWNGTPEQPLQMIADYTGYEFVPSDKKPVLKPVVMIQSTSRPAIDILRDIGNQLGEVAKVRILPSSKKIKLIYLAEK
ncbi:MAG: DotD/TraH family lipoprotein [Pseudomonadota bacterium]|nr:DotD/TraH family lipoprotein [Pseudomonadota bacterium]